jgi:hypothetical protein
MLSKILFLEISDTFWVFLSTIFFKNGQKMGFGPKFSQPDTHPNKTLNECFSVRAMNLTHLVLKSNVCLTFADQLSSFRLKITMGYLSELYENVITRQIKFTNILQAFTHTFLLFIALLQSSIWRVVTPPPPPEILK